MNKGSFFLTRFFRKILLVGILALPMVASSAFELSGTKLEYMNAANTNFYGFGLFTTDKRFDAEMEFFASTRAFQNDAAYYFHEYDYKLWFIAFSGYLHFIRTDNMSFYAGVGIMPFIPRRYAYHFTIGTDFFFTEAFRVFYNYRIMENNAADFAYPRGTSYSFGFKYTTNWFNG